MKLKLASLVCFLFLFCSQFVQAQQLAFPSAEGHGKYAQGGRGGAVIYVTNLNDSGAGSLRDAIENKSGARTIVFSVGGSIALKSQLTLKDDAYVTIAGQTAPGGGICIQNYPLMIQGCNHIVVRYLRSRLGDLGDGEDDALSVRSSRNVILDHCSLGWSIDSILDVTHNSGAVTVQYSILSEALVNSRHQKGSHGYAAGWDGKGGASYHHNLIAHCVSRTPRLDSYLNDDGTKDLIEVVNNVIYNWSSYGAYGGENADVNWIGNYYRFGPETPTDRKSWVFGAGSDVKMYVTDNYVYGFPEVTKDNSLGINYDGKNLEQIRRDVLVSEAFDTEGINVEDAEDAYKNVLANAGATLPIRDAVDTRVLNDVINATGGYIDSQTEVGSWPDYALGTAPTDTDKDGMPDQWEKDHQLDENDATDRNADRDNDGYTNLEEYLNSLVVFNDPSQINLPPVPVESVTIEGAVDSLAIGASPLQLSALVLPENAAEHEVEWSVSGNAATIDESGVLTPVLPGKAIVKALATDGSGKYGFVTIVITEAVLAAPNIGFEQSIIYPNPTKGAIEIRSDQTIRNLELYSLQGKLLKTSKTHKMDLSKLDSGLYLLKLDNGVTVENIKVLKE